jgi:vanillate O-demethylase monooxygenase subunit
MSWGASRPKITPIECGLRIARWVVNNPAPSYLSLPEACTDMWASYDYLVPGVFLLTTQSHPPGTAAACNMAAPSSEPMWWSLISQAVTPISERQTIYYYSGCLSRSYATEEQSRRQIAVFEKAFAEDKAMIEAQQRVIYRTQERRMMAGLIEAEQTPRSRPAERRFA